MATEEKNRPCNGCGAEPGERHRDYDDLARCRSTGNQLIACEGELHEFKGNWYGIHEGPCGPDVWDGEYPGVKQCREFGLYTASGNEDLNRLYEFSIWDNIHERLIYKGNTNG